MRARLLLVLLLLARAGFAGDAVRLTILHTNDLHGQIEPLPASPTRAVLRGKDAGGFAHLATMVRAARREAEGRGTSLLLLDAGDLFQGTPIGNETRGLAVVDAMNALAYDAVAVGNHELDYGLFNLLDLAERARFPMLCANMTRERGSLAPIKPYVVLGPPRVPCRVVVIGLVTPGAAFVTIPGRTSGLRFSDPVDVARSVLRDVEGDLYVALTHLGHEYDLALARGVPELDLIVAGHTHTAFTGREAGVPVVRTHARGLSLGRVDLDLDPETWEVRDFDAQLLPVDPAATPADVRVAAAVEEHARKLDGKLNEIVGKLAAPARSGDYLHASPAGQWVADAIRAAGAAEIGIMNKGGIRAELEAGDVRYADVYRFVPFDNAIVSMDLTGADLIAIVERHFRNGGYPALDWSGMEAVARRKGGRVSLVELRTEDGPVDPGKTYRVATNSFLANGGDGFHEFRRGRKVERGEAWLRDVLADDLRARSPLTPPPHPRTRLAVPAAAR